MGSVVAQLDGVGYGLSMELKEKIFLGGSIVCLIAGGLIAFGVLDPGIPSLHVLLPLGVILAGMFMVTRMLERPSKVAVDDQQRELHKAGIDVPRSETPTRQGGLMTQ